MKQLISCFEFGPDPSPPNWINEPISQPPDQELENQRRKELVSWWLENGYKELSIKERLVYFWSNHFVIEASKVKNPQMLYSINQLFRKFADGNIRELTKAVGKEPAMLIYLDGIKNTKKNLNENYARELQELFTIGIGNYSQEDVVAAARAYTGWQIDKKHIVGFFNPKRHDFGIKTFYGKNGKWNGDDIVDLIFEKKETALFLSKKLYQHFVYQQIDEQIVEQIASIMIANDFELRPVIKTLLKSEHFMDEAFIGADIKSPMDFLLGFLRQIKAKKINWEIVSRLLRGLGQTIFDPPNVAGWAGHRSWLSAPALALRWEIPSRLFRNHQSKWFDLNLFLSFYPETNDPEELINQLLEDFLAIYPGDEVKIFLLKMLTNNNEQNTWHISSNLAKNNLLRVLTAITQCQEYQLN